MRICDRCHGRDGSAVVAVDSITFDRDHETMDVCESCKQEAQSFIKNPPKTIKETDGRKRTRKASNKT